MSPTDKSGSHTVFLLCILSFNKSRYILSFIKLVYRVRIYDFVKTHTENLMDHPDA